MAIDCDVHYDWAGEFGLLATVIRLLRYLTEEGLDYVKPVQPPTLHLPYVLGGTVLQIPTWEADKNLKRRNLAVFRGFRRRI